MDNNEQTQAQLRQELAEARQRIAELEAGADGPTGFIVNNLPDMLSHVDGNRIVQFASLSVQRYLGYAPQDLIGTPALDLVHPDDIVSVRAAIRAAIANQEGSVRVEYRYRHADGHYLWLETIVTLFHDEDGQFAGAIFSGRDVSARKQLEQTLRMFQYTIDQSTDAIFWINREAQFEYVNAQACKMLGYSHEEFLSLSLWDIDPVFPQEEWESLWDRFQQNQQGFTRNLESVQRHKDGTLIPVDVTSQHLLFEGQELHVAVVRDARARKQAEAALRESEGRYRSLFDGVPTGLYRTTPEGAIIDANPTFVAMLGYPDQGALLTVNATEIYVDPEERERCRVVLERDGVLSAQQIQLRRLDGSIIWVEDSARAVYDADNRISHFEGAITDITDRRRAEMALRYSEERYRMLFENAPIGIGLSTPEGQVIMINETLEQLYGFTLDDLNTIDPHEGYRNPDERRRLMESLEKNGYVKDFEITLRRKDGTYFDASMTMAPFPLVGDDFVLTMVIDITERKRAEAGIARFFEQPLVMLFIADLEKNALLRVNNEVIRIIGHSEEELLSKPFSNFIHPEDREKTFQAIASMADGVPLVNFRNRNLTKDGAVQVFEWTAIADSERRLLYAMARDVTEQIAAEEALLESERLLRESQAIARLGSYNFDLRSGTIVTSAELDAIIGVKAGSQTDLNSWMAHIHPDDIDEMADYIGNHVLKEGRPINKEYRIIRHNDGQVRWVHSIGHLETGDDGNPLRIVGTLQDITDRKLVEEALRESEERYRSLFDDSPISLWEQDFSALKTTIDDLKGSGVSDLDQYFEDHPEAVRESVAKIKVVDVNQATLALYGAQDKEELLRGLERYITDESLAALREELVAFANGATYFVGENVNRTLAGETLSCMVSTSIAPGSEETWEKALVSVIDITEQKRLEEESRKAEILRAELAKEKEVVALKERFISTVSHEFRTPLAVIQTSTDMLTRYYEKLTDERRQELLQQIAQQILTMTTMIDNILDIGRGQAGGVEFNPVPIELESFCRDIFETIQFSSGKNQQFDFRSTPSTGLARIDGQLLHRILSNVLWNAVKYTPEQGRITFELVHAEAEVILRIIDEGIGIPEADLDQLFEPFHRATNVGKEKGSGLGLAIVKQYVEIHGGTIAVDSQVGEGSTFTISLPIG